MQCACAVRRVRIVCAMWPCSLPCACAACNVRARWLCIGLCHVPVQCVCSLRCASLQCACAVCAMCLRSVPVLLAVCLCTLQCACAVCNVFGLCCLRCACAVCSVPVQFCTVLVQSAVCLCSLRTVHMQCACAVRRVRIVCAMWLFFCIWFPTGYTTLLYFASEREGYDNQSGTWHVTCDI